jgi:hypothetical protein
VQKEKSRFAVFPLGITRPDPWEWKILFVLCILFHATLELIRWKIELNFSSLSVFFFLSVNNFTLPVYRTRHLYEAGKRHSFQFRAIGIC